MKKRKLKKGVIWVLLAVVLLLTSLLIYISLQKKDNAETEPEAKQSVSEIQDTKKIEKDNTETTADPDSPTDPNPFPAQQNDSENNGNGNVNSNPAEVNHTQTQESGNSQEQPQEQAQVQQSDEDVLEADKDPFGD